MDEINEEKLYNILNEWNKNDLIDYIINNTNINILKEFFEK